MGNCWHTPASCDSFSQLPKMENAMVGRENMSSTSTDCESSSVAKTIKESMVHWSQLSDGACNNEGEAAEIDNMEVFKQLQSHPQWGHFFITFGYSLGIFPSVGSLEEGHKFAEGGQAELFHAHIKWDNPKLNDEDREEGREWVLKVFKKGTLLRHLQSQWPNGYLQVMADDLHRHESGMPPSTMYCSDVHVGVLLKDGRFAFLIQKEQEDLRNLINGRMLSNTADCMPFDKGDAEVIMYRIAIGMDWLHRHNIVHRDLKAANVLYSVKDQRRYIYVADYECSVGVIGTGFWRAPEILQAVKDKTLALEVFTKKVDVYAYGITCYEILSGELPFDGHPWNDYDLILERKQRPVLPEYVDDWMRDLVSRCWEQDPASRPSFQEVMDLLAANSLEVRASQLARQQWEDDRQRNWERKKKKFEYMKKFLMIDKKTLVVS